MKETKSFQWEQINSTGVLDLPTEGSVSNKLVLTRTWWVRLAPSFCCPDLSSCLLPGGQKHSMETEFKALLPKLNTRITKWFGDSRRTNLTVPTNQRWSVLFIIRLLLREQLWFYFTKLHSALAETEAQNHCTNKQNKKNPRSHKFEKIVPLCSQGDVVFQQGVENRVVSASLLLFCSFSSSVSSLPQSKRLGRKKGTG